MKKYLNFCEKSIDDIDLICSEISKNLCDGVSIGSYTCDVGFINNIKNKLMKKSSEINTNGVSVRIVLPIFSESLLDEGKTLIKELLEQINVCALVVNDIGMLDYLYRELGYNNIQLGRLFFKEERDPRILELSRNVDIKTLTKDFEVLLQEYSVKGMEFDSIYNFHNLINCFDESLELWVHYPLTYITSSRICFFKSVNQSHTMKFRVNKSCDLECMAGPIKYITNDNKELYRIGKGIYFDCDFKIDDYIDRVNIIYYSKIEGNEKI